MSYIVESGASSSRRSRRRRALVTLSFVVLMLFFAFWYAYSYYQESTEPTAAPAATCTTTTAATTAPAKAAPKPSDVTVNVYNATERDGLAATTATEVRARGFEVATITNDPLGRTVAGTAEVRYGKSGAAKAKLVLAMVKGAKGVPDGRNDSSVDLVVGEKFSALVKAKPVAPAATPAC